MASSRPPWILHNHLHKVKSYQEIFHENRPRSNSIFVRFNLLMICFQVFHDYCHLTFTPGNAYLRFKCRCVFFICFNCMTTMFSDLLLLGIKILAVFVIESWLESHTRTYWWLEQYSVSRSHWNLYMTRFTQLDSNPKMRPNDSTRPKT